ncbi:MAG: helix-turn-helix transcriptional regulator [Chthonomonas sp.]|nr:helix-turn-helix transcriptional regulator [Chthonomonas sp.]
MPTTSLVLESGLRRITTKRSFEGECITIDRVSADDAEPERVTISRKPGHELMLFCQQGTLLVRKGSGAGWEVLPAGSMALFTSNTPIDGIMARGPFTAYWVQWTHDCAKLLSDWLKDHRSKSKSESAISIVKATLPENQSIADEVTQMVLGMRDVIEPRLQGGLQMLAVSAAMKGTKGALTPIPTDLAHGMLKLVKAVQADPVQDWSLKQSSQVAGYSQFHLSRAFRIELGYGLPEFVERCRVEMALNMVDSRQRDMHEIAAVCGFSTPSSFREGLKKILGVLPSELRRYTIDKAR